MLSHVAAQFLRTAKSAVAYRAAVAIVIDGRSSDSIRHRDGGWKNSSSELSAVYVEHSRHVEEGVLIHTKSIAWCCSK